jgi:hypothetical protein
MLERKSFAPPSTGHLMRSGREAVKRERLGWRSDISAGINQDDFFGCFPVGLQEDLQQQAVYLSLIQHDLFAALIRIFYLPQQRHDLPGLYFVVGMSSSSLD